MGLGKALQMTNKEATGFVSVLIGARRGARRASIPTCGLLLQGFSPHRCEAWGSAEKQYLTVDQNSVSVLIGARRGARPPTLLSIHINMCGFSPHRCEAWGSASIIGSIGPPLIMFQSSSVRGVGLGNRSMEVRIFQEVSVLIGARRGARLACCDHSECCCLGFSPHRCEAWGSASGNIAFSWPKGSFSPHRCEAWGSAIRRYLRTCSSNASFSPHRCEAWGSAS